LAIFNEAAQPSSRFGCGFLFVCGGGSTPNDKIILSKPLNKSKRMHKITATKVPIKVKNTDKLAE
jgi:hypothetical protein